MEKAVSEKLEQYPRFRVGAQIEHIVLLVSFTVLAITGLPQKYAASDVGEWAINLMGGIETVRLIHRWSAIILILGSVYHLITGAYRFFVKHERMRIVPDLKDARDAANWVLYNLGFNDEHPKMRKFNFGEKFEYWAVVWGTAVMIVTGFMLMNPIATTSIFPGEIIPAAKAAHGYEALLAVLAILVWHLYNVLIKQFNPSMWTGKLPRDQMEEEHALELERLEAGEDPWPKLERPVLQHRRRIFFAASIVVGVIAIAIVIWAFTFEQTAIITITPTPGP